MTSLKRCVLIAVILVMVGIIVLLSHQLWCNHDFEVSYKKDATCIHSGEIGYECRFCGKSDVEPIEPLDHNMRYDSTELEEVGNSLYSRAIYICDRCGQKFSDEPEYFGEIPNKDG